MFVAQNPPWHERERGVLFKYRAGFEGGSETQWKYRERREKERNSKGLWARINIHSSGNKGLPRVHGVVSWVLDVFSKWEWFSQSLTGNTGLPRGVTVSSWKELAKESQKSWPGVWVSSEWAQPKSGRIFSIFHSTNLAGFILFFPPPGKRAGTEHFTEKWSHKRHTATVPVPAPCPLCHLFPGIWEEEEN